LELPILRTLDRNNQADGHMRLEPVLDRLLRLIVVRRQLRGTPFRLLALDGRRCRLLGLAFLRLRMHLCPQLSLFLALLLFALLIAVGLFSHILSLPRRLLHNSFAVFVLGNGRLFSFDAEARAVAPNDVPGFAHDANNLDLLGLGKNLPTQIPDNHERLALQPEAALSDTLVLGLVQSAEKAQFVGRSDGVQFRAKEKPRKHGKDKNCDRRGNR